MHMIERCRGQFLVASSKPSSPNPLPLQIMFPLIAVLDFPLLILLLLLALVVLLVLLVLVVLLVLLVLVVVGIVSVLVGFIVL